MPKNFTFEPTEEFMQTARKACAMSFRLGEKDTETNSKKRTCSLE